MNVCLMVGRRLRCWVNIKQTLVNVSRETLDTGLVLGLKSIPALKKEHIYNGLRPITYEAERADQDILLLF